MTSPVEISLREVYDAVKELSGKVDASVSKTTLLEYRIEQLEKQQSSNNTNRPVWFGVGGSFLAAIGAYLAPFIH